MNLSLFESPSVWSAVAVVVSLWAMILSVRANRMSQETAKKQLALNELLAETKRPQFSVVSMVDRLSGRGLGVKFVIKNQGEIAAHNCRSTLELWADGPNLEGVKHILQFEWPSIARDESQILSKDYLDDYVLTQVWTGRTPFFACVKIGYEGLRGRHYGEAPRTYRFNAEPDRKNFELVIPS